MDNATLYEDISDPESEMSEPENLDDFDKLQDELAKTDMSSILQAQEFDTLE